MCIPRHDSKLSELKEYMYARNRAMRRNNLINLAVHQQSDTDAEQIDGGFPQFWYVAEATYSCEHTERVGDVLGDGAKYLCNLHHLKKQKSCLYYGFGVDKNMFFEESLLSILDEKSCEMFAFEPVAGDLAMQRLTLMNISFKPWALNAFDDDQSLIDATPWIQVFTLSTIRQMLGHEERVIDIVKMDIQGAEWAVMNQLLTSCSRRRPLAHQLLVKFYYPEKHLFLEVIERLDMCGYRLFMKETNLYFPECAELAFVHEMYLKCIT